MTSGYEGLSALDASFLLLEKPHVYTHVASTLIFDLQVRNRKQLATVIRNLRKMPEVMRVTRVLA